MKVKSQIDQPLCKIFQKLPAMNQFIFTKGYILSYESTLLIKMHPNVTIYPFNNLNNLKKYPLLSKILGTPRAMSRQLIIYIRISQ